MSLITQLLDSGQQSNRGEVTVEAAISSAAEMSQLDVEINNEIAQMGRLEDIAEGLDNVVSIAGHVKAATRPEMALVANCVDLAFAGENSNAIVEGATFGLESAEGSTMAVEGIKSIAIKLWEGIKRLMRNIREKVVGFFKARWGAVASLRKTLTKLKTRAEKANGKTVEENKTEIGRELKVFYKEDSLITGEKDFAAAISSIKTLANKFFINYAKDVNEAGQQIIKGMEAFDTTASVATAAVETAIEKAKDLTGPYEASMKLKTDSDDSRIPDDMEFNSLPLLCNQVIFSYKPNLAANATSAEKGALISKSRVMYTNFGTKKSKVKDEGTLATYSASTIMDICDDLLSSLEELERYEGGSVFKEIDKVNKEIQKVGDSIAKDVAKDDEADEGVISSSKAMRSLATGYARWTSEGFTSFSKHIMDVGNGFATAANKMLSNYK